MGQYYSLSAECGPDEKAAELFESHFSDFTIHLTTGEQIICYTRRWKDSEGNYWAWACPSGMKGSWNLSDPTDMTECGFALYRKLLDDAPPFRYALAGIEVDDFRTWKELKEDVAILPDGTRVLAYEFKGLVVSNELWRELGEPIHFGQFGAGCMWTAYDGEGYSPLKGDRERSRKLLAMYLTLPGISFQNEGNG